MCSSDLGIRPIGAWVEALAAEYEVDRGTLEQDVLRFAAELAGEGILEPLEDTGG